MQSWGTFTSGGEFGSFLAVQTAGNFLPDFFSIPYFIQLPAVFRRKSFYRYPDLWSDPSMQGTSATRPWLVCFSKSSFYKQLCWSFRWTLWHFSISFSKKVSRLQYANEIFAQSVRHLWTMAPLSISLKVYSAVH